VLRQYGGHIAKPWAMAMVSLAIQQRMKMMPNGRCGPGWNFGSTHRSILLRSKNIRLAVRIGIHTA